MVLSAGIKSLSGFLILFLMSLFIWFWKLHITSLNSMFWMRPSMPSSKVISSLILGGEFRDLNPYVSLVVDSVGK